jgi:predicted MPP superfamily phosphohydrolase
LEHADQAGATRYVFLGDLVGYNANPAEVLNHVKTFMQQGKAIAGQGNHDKACYTRDCTGMNPVASVAIDWTANNLDTSYLDFLKNLPYIIKEEDRC